MKKLSRRMVSIMLSILMVVTAMPISAITAYATTTPQTNWTILASSDFAAAAASGNYSYQLNTNRNDQGDEYFINGTSGTSLPTTSAGGNAMGFDFINWKQNYYGSTYDRSDATGVQFSNDGGSNVNDGFQTGDSGSGGGFYFMSSYNGQTSTTPFQSLNSNSSIKVEFRFKYNSTTFNNTSDNDGCIFKLSTNSNYTFDWCKEEAWSNHFYSQAFTGKNWNAADGTTADTTHKGNGYYMTAGSSGALSAYTWYHYVFVYEYGHVYTYVTDDSGNIVLNFTALRKDLDPTTITGMYIGSCKENYPEDFVVSDVEIYSGTPTASFTHTGVGNDEKGEAKDKYLYAYFTGNSADGEQLRYAVSDDGYQWEALNGGDAVVDLSSTYSGLTVYPTGTATSIAGSGHVRDPYVFRAQDGSFYVLATDLNTDNGSNWGNNSKMLVWHLNELEDIATTAPWYIDITGMMATYGFSYVQRAWAPEAVWDPEVGKYMLVFGCGYYPDGSSGYNTHMYYVYTSDFKTFTDPEVLLDISSDNIDGNLTYDSSNGLWYLWYKDEANSRIGYSTSPHASGPYTAITTFTDSNYASKFEGPEVYQLYSTGSYVLMADHYASSLSYFATYSGTDLESFENNSLSTYFNYLSPRHGGVVNITTAEYNDLIAEFGKVTYDASGLTDGSAVNSHLVARYFTEDSANVNSDLTGNGYTLTSSNLTMVDDYDGRSAAYFESSDGDNTSSNSASSMKSSYYKSYSYATVDTSAMLSGIDIDDGVTFSWYGYALNANAGRWFDWTTASDAGQVSWDDELGTGESQTNTKYVYASSAMEFGASNGSPSISTGYKGTGYKGEWHLYTFTISKNYTALCVDGDVLRYEYAKNGESITKSGSPIYTAGMNQSFFNSVKAGKLMLGISSYAADEMLNGYISDFRVYDRALSNYGITESLKALGNTVPDTDVGDSDRAFYDPMENLDVDGDGTNDYTSYSATTTDTAALNGNLSGITNVHGNILNISSHKAASHYTYTGASSDTGYTVSTWYNPGSTCDGQAIFYIGTDNGRVNTPYQYFYVTNDGYLYFNNQVSSESYVDIENVFGNGFSFSPNTWYHISFVIVPINTQFDKIYVNINGKTVNKINTNKLTNSLVDGQSICNFFSSNKKVYYGLSAYNTGTWGGRWANSTSGYLDDFSIYTDAYSAESVYNKDCLDRADELLELAQAKYVAAMSALSSASYVYEDMADAYYAYDEASRYVDAYTYGGYAKKASEVAELYVNLQKSIDEMESQQYSTPDTVQGYSVSGKNAVSETYTHNMLTKPTGLFQGNESETTNNGNTRVRLSGSDFVWLYTGNTNDTPIAPYNSGGYKNAWNWTVRNCYIAVNNSVPMKFGGAGVSSDNDLYWHYYDGWNDSAGSSANVNWFYEVWSTDTSLTSGNKRTVMMTASYESGHRSGKFDDQKWYNGSGYAQFLGDESTFKTTDSTYSDSSITRSSTSTYTKNGETYSYILSFAPTFIGGQGDSKADVQVYRSTTGTIKVINYKHVYDVLNDSTRRGYLANITSYTPASAKALLEAYDALTSTVYTMSATSDAESLAADLKTKVDALEDSELTASLVAKADYSALNTAVNASSVNTKLYNSLQASEGGLLETDGNGDFVDANSDDLYDAVGSGNYTTSSLNAFYDAYSSVKTHYASLNPYGDDNNYVTSNATITKLIISIEKAGESLVEAADYSDVEADTADNTTYSNDFDNGNYVNSQQVYTYDTFVAFAPKYVTEKSWAAKSAAYKADTEKYPVTYKASDTVEVDGNTVTLSSGPFIAFNAADEVITSDTTDKTAYYYKYCNAFYVSSGDDTPDEFDEGNWVLVDGDWYNVQGYRYYPDSITTSGSTYSTRQTAINTSKTEMRSAHAALAVVDAAANYQTFDAAYSVVDSANEDKYTEAGLTALNGAKAELNSVYKVLTAEEATAYNNITGRSYSAGAKIKNTTTNGTDSHTSTMLTAANNIEAAANKATYVKKFKVDFNLVNGETTTSDSDAVYYGDTSKAFALGDGAYNSKFSVTYFDGVYDTANPTATGSSKFSYAGESFSKVAKSNMAITCTVTQSSAVEGSKKVEIRDIYGTVVNILYTANPDDLPADGETTLTIDGATITPSGVPFYEFSSWHRDDYTDSATNKRVVSYTPVYNANAMVSIDVADVATVTGASFDETTSKYQTELDTLVTVDASAVEGFYAWATISSENDKYQIASYEDAYSFYAMVPETFVIITKNGGKYYKPDGTELTAADVDTSFGVSYDESSVISDDVLLKQKLDGKAPFISLVSANIAEGNKKANVYCRVTTGASTNYSEIGVLATSKAADEAYMVKGTATLFKTSTVSDTTGQFTYTISRSSTTFTAVTFRAYMSYALPYSFNGSSYNVNVDETSDSIIVARASA